MRVVLLTEGFGEPTGEEEPEVIPGEPLALRSLPGGSIAARCLAEVRRLRPDSIHLVAASDLEHWQEGLGSLGARDVVVTPPLPGAPGFTLAAHSVPGQVTLFVDARCVVAAEDLRAAAESGAALVRLMAPCGNAACAWRAPAIGASPASAGVEERDIRPAAGARTLDSFHASVLAAVERACADGQPRVEAGASVHPGAALVGPVWVEAGAEIQAGATVQGPGFVGAGSLIRAGANVNRSVVLQGSEVGAIDLHSSVVSEPRQRPPAPPSVLPGFERRERRMQSYLPGSHGSHG